LIKFTDGVNWLVFYCLFTFMGHDVQVNLFPLLWGIEGGYFSGELRNGAVQIWTGVVSFSWDFTFGISILNLISFIATNVLV